MIKHRVMIKDERGNSLPLFDEGALAKFSDDRVRRIAFTAYDHSRGRTLGGLEVAAGAGIAALMLAALALNDLEVWPRQPRPLLFLPVLIVGSPLFFLMHIGMRRTQATRVRSAMLDEKLCPSCGYDLTQAKREAVDGSSDTLVHCAECGGWWRS